MVNVVRVALRMSEVDAPGSHKKNVGPIDLAVSPLSLRACHLTARVPIVRVWCEHGIGATLSIPPRHRVLLPSSTAVDLGTKTNTTARGLQLTPERRVVGGGNPTPNPTMKWQK